MPSEDTNAWLRSQLTQLNKDLAEAESVLAQAKEELAQASKISGAEIQASGSITGGGALMSSPNLRFVNDQDHPPPNAFYGTDGDGRLGYYEIPVTEAEAMLKADYDADSDGVVDSAASVPDIFLTEKFAELFRPIVASMIFGATQPGAPPWLTDFVYDPNWVGTIRYQKNLSTGALIIEGAATPTIPPAADTIVAFGTMPAAYIPVRIIRIPLIAEAAQGSNSYAIGGGMSFHPDGSVVVVYGAANGGSLAISGIVPLD